MNPVPNPVLPDEVESAALARAVLRSPSGAQGVAPYATDADLVSLIHRLVQVNEGLREQVGQMVHEGSQALLLLAEAAGSDSVALTALQFVKDGMRPAAALEAAWLVEN